MRWHASGVAVTGKGIATLPDIAHTLGISAEPASLVGNPVGEDDASVGERLQIYGRPESMGGGRGAGARGAAHIIYVDLKTWLLGKRQNVSSLAEETKGGRGLQHHRPFQDMEHRQIISNSPAGSTASRPSRISTQVAGSQGSRFQPEGTERVEVTVIRAHNVPQFGSILGVKTDYFVTVTYGATTKKTKKKTKKTKSVQMDGQMAPSSRLIIRLYAKRLRINDTLIGTHEVVIPVERNISVALGQGDGQAESTPPVTLDLTITVSTNGAPQSDPQTIPTEGDDTPAEDIPQPTMAPDSRRPDQFTAPEHPLPPPDHLPVNIGTPMPQDLETSFVEARIDLDRADEVEKSIDRSNTWEGVVEKIKWVMDKLSPVAELHPIAQMAYKVLSVIPEELS
ncbi:hypothetical protein EDB92DRAFT_2106289, partial [Lactarius akahatsu]